MRISIVTPSLNHARYIEQTIRSVLDQDYPDVEHIVVDGGSADGTLEILRRYPRLRWVSEEDSGQSSAINKGFAMATGEILAWLNSDDFYPPGVLSAVAGYFGSHPDCMVLYGDITFVGEQGEPLCTIAGETLDYQSLINCPDLVRQPSVFWRKKALEELGEGGLDETLHLVMDFDLFLRLARRYPFHYLPRTLSFYRSYAANKTNTFRLRQTREIYKVFRKRNVRLRLRHLRYFAGKLLDAFAAGRALKSLFRPVPP